MVAAVALFFLLPTLVTCSGEGNIHLLHDEVAAALRACSYNDTTNTRNNGNNRQRRSDENDYKNQTGIEARIDDGTNQDMNLYGHERRNSSMRDYGRNDTGIAYVRTADIPARSNNVYSNSIGNWTRSKRSNSLIDKADSDQCLSQCVFANLQVVDAMGIPREAELWNKLQTALTSQQSRTVLKDQIRACFQELQTEAEDNGCSYSNKLERCLMLRFADRKTDKKTNQSN